MRTLSPYELVTFSYQGRQLPSYMFAGIMRYVNDGAVPGDFLQGIICNDLRKACAYADDTNLWLIPVYVAFFHNEVPGICWGSYERMVDWCNEKAGQRERELERPPE
jgi:hypothetical protein